MPDPCVHEERWNRHEQMLQRLSASRHAIFEWMVISAAVAVLVLTYHIYINMRNLAKGAQRMEQQMDTQNSILREIHSAIHEEGLRDYEQHNSGSHQKGSK